MAEREKYPLGKAAPYTPDHPNLLTRDTAPPAPVRLISGALRAVLLLLALALMGHALYGVAIDDLWLPAKHSPGRHYHGVAALCMAMMLLSMAAWLVVTAYARYDPQGQPKAARLLLGTALVFMVAGVVL